MVAVPESEPIGANHLRVLIVEDDLGSTQALRAALERAGLEVRVASKSADALAMLEEYHPDTTIVDIGLPAASSYDLLASLRTRDGFASCRFIAVTGYVADGFTERSVAAGFEAHLTKPVAPSAVLRIILCEARANTPRR